MIAAKGLFFQTTFSWIVISILVVWLHESDHHHHPMGVQALSSLAPTAAASSPLFRYCPPPQGPNDQQATTTTALQGTVISSVEDGDDLHSTTTTTKVNVQALQELGYPNGLCRALSQAAQVYAKRYWIIDDSLSMSTKDGHFLLHTPQKHGKEDRIEQAPCSRWNELQETVLQHSLLALHLEIPTDFRLLNHAAGHFRIPRTLGHKQRSSLPSPLTDVQHAQKLLSRTKPRGVTPLTARLRTVHKELSQSVLPKLESNKKVAIVLATDGLPTNADDHGSSTLQAKQDFHQALKALPEQQISVVIRLCTDDTDVVSYYNQLATNLPHVQVLDDYWAEAEQVQAHNPWLNYGLVLHRIREMGCCGHVPLLSALAQRPLTPDEVAEFVAFVLDWRHEIPPTWDNLVQTVDQHANDVNAHVWNPMTGQMDPWFDLKKYHIAEEACPQQPLLP